MLAGLVSLTTVLLATASGMPRRRRRPKEAIGGPAWQAARLAAQVAILDATLCEELRQTSRQTAELAGELAAVLGRFTGLEARFASVMRQVEADTGQAVDNELYELLIERLEITKVRVALEQLARAHPDEVTGAPGPEPGVPPAAPAA